MAALLIAIDAHPFGGAVLGAANDWHASVQAVRIQLQRWRVAVE